MTSIEIKNPNQSRTLYVDDDYIDPGFIRLNIETQTSDSLIHVSREDFLKVVRALKVTPEELKEPKKSAQVVLQELPVGAVFEASPAIPGDQRFTSVKVGDNQFRVLSGLYNISSDSIFTGRNLVGGQRTEDHIKVIFAKN